MAASSFLIFFNANQHKNNLDHLFFLGFHIISCETLHVTSFGDWTDLLGISWWKILWCVASCCWTVVSQDSSLQHSKFVSSQFQNCSYKNSFLQFHAKHLSPSIEHVTQTQTVNEEKWHIKIQMLTWTSSPWRGLVGCSQEAESSHCQSGEEEEDFPLWNANYSIIDGAGKSELCRESRREWESEEEWEMLHKYQRCCKEGRVSSAISNVYPTETLGLIL